MSSFSLRKATRSKTKIRVGISGPSGSGKTFSALLLASGMTSWDKIALIDTENGSGDLYAHLGPYNVITLTAPFSPERYIEAIKACEKEGMDVIVIDSTSHEWEGKGGCLESNEILASTRFKGNTWAAWSHTTPRHQKFIEAILTSTCHIITTARSKTETMQTDDKKVKKVGTKEIQREGFEYELTINFNLDRDTHYATASKDRTELFEGNPCIITPEIGKKILEWTLTGADPAPAAPQTAPPAERTSGEKPAAQAAPAEKKQPTAIMVMEWLNATKDDKQTDTIYERAMKHPWNEEDKKKIDECRDNVKKRNEKEQAIVDAERAGLQAA